MNLADLIPHCWKKLLAQEITKPYFDSLSKFIADAYSNSDVFPSQHLIFRAYELCPPEQVRVVIVGQDPYHDIGQAIGLSFAVSSGTKLPPSLRNILKEVANCGYEIDLSNGNLERWAKQGVLLLNSVLTVKAHSAASHARQGWEEFTDATIKSLSDNYSGIVYMLWGGYAQKKAQYVDSSKNLILTSVHPSPLSAHRGWFGSAHFSKANLYLENSSRKIDW